MPIFPLYLIGLGMPELVIILVILLVLFGGSRLPSLAKGLGESVRNFKHGVSEDPDEEKDKAKKDDKTKAA